MNDARGMCGCQTCCNLPANRSHSVRRQRAALDSLGQRLAGNVLHNDHERAMGIVNRMNGAHIRVIEGGRGSRLGQDSITSHIAWPEDFQGDGAVEHQVAGAVDDTKCSGAEERFHLILANHPVGAEMVEDIQSRLTNTSLGRT